MKSQPGLDCVQISPFGVIPKPHQPGKLTADCGPVVASRRQCKRWHMQGIVFPDIRACRRRGTDSSGARKGGSTGQDGFAERLPLCASAPRRPAPTWDALEGYRMS